MRSDLLLTIFPDTLCHTAWLILRFQKAHIRSVYFRQVALCSLFLREFVLSLIISRVVLLLLSSVMIHRFSPRIFRSGPRCIRLNVDVVDASAHLEESLIAVFVAPGIAHKPVICSV